MKSYFINKNNICFISALHLQTIHTLLVVFVAICLSILIDAVSDSIQTGNTAYHNKKVLLFDEATSALDSDMAEKIETLILNQRDVTCLFVSHKLSPACVEKYVGILRLERGVSLSLSAVKSS